jgi:NADH-quinone oxidoreductase subunit E
MPAARVRDRFERRREDLIAMLLTIQRGLGYLPEDALLDVAQLTRLPVSTVYGVATFYEQFRLDPCGRHVVKVCRGTACHVRGGDRILRELRTAFRIEPGETTDDNLFTLETVACFGSCALAPVVVIDDTVMGRMTPYRTRAALERLEDVVEPVVSEDRAPVT